MKLRKIKVVFLVIAALVMQGTCASAAKSNDGYDKEEIANRRPGWTYTDKNKSDYNVNSYKNTFSSAEPPSAKDEEEDKEQVLDYNYDQIGSTGGNLIISTWAIAETNNYWGRTSDGRWMFVENGVPGVGWKYAGGSWYYMDSAGIMQTGWVNYNGTWYYLRQSGAMAYNTWIEGYYLDSTGGMR